MKITNYKKIIKFVTLLASALLIGTVSAAVYHHLYLSATVGVAHMENLQWDRTGLDQGVSAIIQGAYCQLLGLVAPSGGSTTYNKAVGIKAIADTTFDIEVVDVTGSTTHLDYILIEVFDGSNIKKGEFYVWQNNQKGTGCNDLTITKDEVWRLQWTIAWKSSASDTDTVTVSLKVTTPSP